MAQYTRKTLQRRVIHQEDDIFSGYSERPPGVTYSKRIKPLPLKGTQFRTHDPYEIPPDSDDEDITPVTKATKKHVAPPDPDDSPLSEDELEAVYGRNASPIQSVQSSPNVPTSSSKTSIDVSSRRSIGKPRRGSSIDKLAQQRPSKRRASGNGKSEQHKRPRTVPQKHNNVEESKPSRKVNKRLPVPARRLPVNELMLVSSPDRHDSPIEPVITHHEMSSDPISASSDPHQSRVFSPIEEVSGNETRAPLTSIRKKLKTPKFTHKSVVALRRKNSSSKSEKPDIGDGFEDSELHVDHSFKVKRRRNDKPLILGFNALSLQAGPLPDVTFEDSDYVLELERSEDTGRTDHDDDDFSADTTERSPELQSSSQKPTDRRVEFSDRVLDEMVMKQLSSISAPRRVYSISSDASDQDQDNFEETDEEEEESEEESDDLEQSQTTGTQIFEPETARGRPQHRKRAPTPPSNQRARQNSSFWRKRSSPVTPGPASIQSEGVTLDFRKRTPHGLGHPPTPFGKRKLVEVDDIIYDEPEREAPSQHMVNVDDMDQDMLDNEVSASPAIFRLPAAQPLHQSSTKVDLAKPHTLSSRLRHSTRTHSSQY